MVIRLAVLDMAGTTVSDGGVVERSFVEALARDGLRPGRYGAAPHLDYVRATMGQSKITVFRAVFGGDEARAQEANRRFEAAFDARGVAWRDRGAPRRGGRARRVPGARACGSASRPASRREPASS